MQIIVVTAKVAAEPAAKPIFFRPAAGGLAKSMAAKPKFFFRRRSAANSVAYRSTVDIVHDADDDFSVDDVHSALTVPRPFVPVTSSSGLWWFRAIYS